MTSGNISRSRSGCWSCRKRRVKCDENRPRCQKCLQSNEFCEYDIRLTWQDDSLARGTCHGRQGVWSKKGGTHPKSANSTKYSQTTGHCFPILDDVYFVNTTFDDLQSYNDRTYKRTKVPEDAYANRSPLVSVQRLLDSQPSPDNLSTILHSVPPSLSIIPSRHHSQIDSLLLSYYESVICSSSTFLDDEANNPYRYVLLPMALQSEGVYHATLAISARTMGFSSPTYSVIALEHQQRALAFLISLINKYEDESRQMDEILGLALMLCWYDISDGCRPSWIQHLKGFRGLMTRYNRASAGNRVRNQNLERFFTQYFIFHLVLAKTTFHDESDERGMSDESLEVLGLEGRGISLLSPGFDRRTDSLALEQLSPSTLFLSLHLSLEDSDEIDLYMGFSNTILLLLNEIAELTSTTATPPLHTLEARHVRILAAAKRLKASLENLEQHLPPFAKTRNLLHRREAVLATAETYRIGALLFLHETLATSVGIAQDSYSIFTKHDKASYISSILDMITVHVNGMIETAVLPLWPLFIAGCCANQEDDRVKALKIFIKAEQPCRFGNITPAREVMEMTWRQRDLTGGDAPQPLRQQQSSKSKRAAHTSRDRNSRLGQSASSSSPLDSGCVEYEWERALNLLGGWRISLT